MSDILGIKVQFAASNVHTPWGKADYRYTFPFRGVILYNTPGHGGLHLSTKFQKIMKLIFGNYMESYEWLEEDCNQFLFYLAFGKTMGIDERNYAIVVENVKHWNPKAFAKFQESPLKVEI